ncbi:UDP-N-acetylmuramoyl-tripeptide--D-alanyl-D-alanine ligase [Actinomadura meridiana]|uniref:UDP-N-acetylmuramoyl-tripeptide--D-alanyl-D-alanine ligase n=1 Tax=Actinomadura meridiana TaxID=559626 RepID=A0ABP8C8R3_9ACTN
MIPLTLAEIAQVTGGTVHGPATTVTGPAVIDSREVTPGSLFVAIVGERSDGHDFAPGAYDAGAVAVLGSRPVDGPCVVVDDVVAALTELAAFVRDGLDPVVIGLTGSVGKTTTKDLLAQILENEGPTVATDRSYNNEIGLPLTILRADRDTRFLVLEMGAGRPGDITHLARVARPRLGLVLNVAPAHLRTLGGLAGIAKAKSELVRALPDLEVGGLALLNADDKAVAAMADVTRAGVLFYGHDADIRPSDVTLDAEGHVSFVLHTPSGEAPVRLRLPGEHQVANALAAASVATAVGVPADRIAAALGSAVPRSLHRFQVIDRPDGVTVIDDAYNANPASMRAALHTMSAMATGRRTIAVLGEMTGQADETAHHHAAIGKMVGDLNIAILVVVGTGDGPTALAAAARRANIFTHALPDRAAALDLLQGLLRPSDVVLIKASSEAALTTLAESLRVPAK